MTNVTHYKLYYKRKINFILEFSLIHSKEQEIVSY